MHRSRQIERSREDSRTQLLGGPADNGRMQPVARRPTRLVVAVALLFLLALSLQLVPVVNDRVMLVWAILLALIAWLGLHRPRPSWQRARLRTIHGSAPPPDRELSASSAMLSRAVKPVATWELVEALRLCGLVVKVRFGHLEIANADQPIARLRKRGAWVPAQMTLELAERGDASVIVAVLVELFGAIEYTSPRGSVVVIE
jgi:hypothetical protein